MHGVQIVTMELSRGREWLWFADLNILALAPHLDAAGRERCVEEAVARSRAELLAAAAVAS